MVDGSVKRCTETMSERESLEAFVEGAKKCASAARELASETKNPEWADIAGLLDSMRDGGEKLSRMKSMSRLETLMAANIKMNPSGILN